MKLKIFDTYIVAVAALLMACACTKNETNTVPEEDLCLSVAFDEMTRLSFSPENGGVIPVHWDADDLLWVNSPKQAEFSSGCCFYTKAGDISGKNTIFYGSVRKDANMAAAFPYDNVKPEASYDKIVFSIPSTQKHVNNSCDSRACYAAAYWTSGTNVKLNYLCGALRFSLTGSGEQVSKLVITDHNSLNCLWGELAVSPNASGTGIDSAEWSDSEVGKNSLSLVCDSPVTLGATATNFIFVLPADCCPDGFSLRAYNASDELIGTVRTVKTKNKVIAGNMISMPAMSITPATPVAFSGGDGTQGNPYIIASKADLMKLAEYVNNEETAASWNTSDTYYKMGGEIDLSGSVFTPIGKTSALAFKAHFYGSMSRISGLTLNGTADGQALFGFTEGADISKVFIDGVNNSSTNTNYSAAIVARAVNSKISDCLFTGNIAIGSVHSGGIVGRLDGSQVENCRFEGNLSTYGTKAHSIGAICGYATSTTASGFSKISNCTFKGKVASTSGQTRVAGIIGRCHKCIVDGCKVEQGSTISSTSEQVGGIAGRMDCFDKDNPSKIMNCEFAGAISAMQTSAGIVGRCCGGSIINCSTTKTASVTCSGYNASGICADVYGGDTGTVYQVLIDKCTNYAAVTATYNVSAILSFFRPADNGSGDLTIRNCGAWNSNNLTATSAYSAGYTLIGGMLAWINNAVPSKVKIQNCYSFIVPVQQAATTRSAIGGIIGWIGVKAGSTADITIEGCYSWLDGTRGSRVNTDKYVGSIYGGSQAAASGSTFTMNYCFATSPWSYCNTACSWAELNNCDIHTPTQNRNGTLYNKLNAFVDASGDPNLLKWSKNSVGYPIFD